MSSPPAPAVAIIDDDAQVGRSLCRFLRESGFEPHVFLSSEDFLQFSPRAHLQCLLLDVQLGKDSGFALHRRLAREGDRTPVIYITAHSEPEVRAEALSLGCAGFVLKTDPGSSLLEVLRRVILKRQPQP